MNLISNLKEIADGCCVRIEIGHSFLENNKKGGLPCIDFFHVAGEDACIFF